MFFVWAQRNVRSDPEVDTSPDSPATLTSLPADMCPLEPSGAFRRPLWVFIRSNVWTLKSPLQLCSDWLWFLLFACWGQGSYFCGTWWRNWLIWCNFTNETAVTQRVDLSINYRSIKIWTQQEVYYKQCNKTNCVLTCDFLSEDDRRTTVCLQNFSHRWFAASWSSCWKVWPDF